MYAQSMISSRGDRHSRWLINNTIPIKVISKSIPHSDYSYKLIYTINIPISLCMITGDENRLQAVAH